MNVVAKARPLGVTVAVAILCIMAVIGCASGAYHLAHNPVAQRLSQQLPYAQAVQYGGLVFSLVLNLFFAIMVFFRHNWARVVVLVFYVLGVVLSLPSFLGAFHISAQTMVFSIIGFLVQLVALVLLFTGPRSQWFRRVAA